MYLQVPTSETLTSRQDRVSRAYGVNEVPGPAGKQMAAGDDMPGGHMAAGSAVRRSYDGDERHTHTHTQSGTHGQKQKSLQPVSEVLFSCSKTCLI